MYKVIGTNGEVYGPVSLPTLKEWAVANRLEPQTMLIDPITGETKRAEQMLEGWDVFAPKVPPIIAPPQTGGHVVVSAPPTYPAPASYPGPAMVPIGQLQPASLLLRFVGEFIDFLCALPLIALSAIPLVGIFFTPLLCLYWLSRDSFFGGQSIGKRVVGVRVVREDGQPFTWSNSATRNIIYLTTLVMMVPFVGDALVPLCVGLPHLVEIILVLTTRKRIGDHFGHTVVVAA